jgi:hypothetical protein
MREYEEPSADLKKTLDHDLQFYGKPIFSKVFSQTNLGVRESDLMLSRQEHNLAYTLVRL